MKFRRVRDLLSDAVRLHRRRSLRQHEMKPAVPSEGAHTSLLHRAALAARTSVLMASALYAMTVVGSSPASASGLPAISVFTSTGGGQTWVAPQSENIEI